MPGRIVVGWKRRTKCGGIRQRLFEAGKEDASESKRREDYEQAFAALEQVVDGRGSAEMVLEELSDEVEQYRNLLPHRKVAEAAPWSALIARIERLAGGYTFGPTRHSLGPRQAVTK